MSTAYRTTGRAQRRPGSTRAGFLVALVLSTGMVGCTATTASSSPEPSTVPSASGTALASPTATPAPTPAPPLTFVATGSMHTARSGATATYIPSIGKVLIAGGADSADMYDQDVYSSAELYDPATGTFSPTGSMNAARQGATATLLADGRVLIAGGWGCAIRNRCTGVAAGAGAGNLASAEIYEPGTGTFSKTGSMAQGRVWAAAARLPNGKVLVDGDGQQAEIYDPNAGKFARIGPTRPVTGNNTATLLPNGKVLVTGADYYDTVSQLFDESTGKFTDVSLALPAGTPTASYRGQVVRRVSPGTATLLRDGRVLLLESGYLETYDPATGACADLGFISPAGPWGDTASLLADGRVLFEGGVTADPWSYGPTTSEAAVLYDPAGGPLRTGSGQVVRASGTATLLPDGDVLIAGGEDADGKPLASAELIKP